MEHHAETRLASPARPVSAGRTTRACIALTLSSLVSANANCHRTEHRLRVPWQRRSLYRNLFFCTRGPRLVPIGNAPLVLQRPPAEARRATPRGSPVARPGAGCCSAAKESSCSAFPRANQRWLQTPDDLLWDRGGFSLSFLLPSCIALSSRFLLLNDSCSAAASAAFW